MLGPTARVLLLRAPSPDLVGGDAQRAVVQGPLLLTQSLPQGPITTRASIQRTWQVSREDLDMRVEIRQGLLFAAGCAFSAVILPLLPDGTIGLASHGTVLWLAFYPFAISTTLPERVYWMFLLVGLPVAVYVGSSAMAPIYEKVALAMFVIAVVGFSVQTMLRRRRGTP